MTRELNHGTDATSGWLKACRLDYRPSRADPAVTHLQACCAGASTFLRGSDIAPCQNGEDRHRTSGPVYFLSHYSRDVHTRTLETPATPLRMRQSAWFAFIQQRRWLALELDSDDDISLPWLDTDIMVHALRASASCISRISDKTSMGLFGAVSILGSRAYSLPNDAGNDSVLVSTRLILDDVTSQIFNPLGNGICGSDGLEQNQGYWWHDFSQLSSKSQRSAQPSGGSLRVDTHHERSRVEQILGSGGAELSI